jgi:hypothetical protein
MTLHATRRSPRRTPLVPSARTARSALIACLALLPGCEAPVQSPAAPAAVALVAPPPAAAPPPEAAAPGVAGQHSGETYGGLFRVAWTSTPDPIPFNASFALDVTVTSVRHPDQPLPHATLEANALMPEHGHGMNTKPRVTPLGDGRFRVDGMLFHMPGLWNLVFVVKDGRAYGQAILPVTIE